MTTATLTPTQLEFIDRVNGFVNIIEKNGENTNIESIIKSIRELEEDISKHIKESLMTDGEKKVFALSCYLIAELFRFYPISSENIINISAGFFDIGSLILMNGCYKKKISYLLFILYFSICILHYIWFSVLMKKTPYKFPF